VSRSDGREGASVEVVFTIKNMWVEPRTLQRENAFVQAIMPFSHEVERTWSEQSGRDHCGFELAPGASSTIEWVIKDLGEGHDAFPSR